MKKRSRGIGMLVCATGIIALTMGLSGCSKSGTPAQEKAPEVTETKAETTAAGSKEESTQETSEETKAGSGELIVYTPLTDDFLKPIVGLYEEQTGIKVSVVTASTGELLTRIEAEVANPMGDVLLSGTISSCKNYKDYFGEYVSVNNDKIREGMRCIDGRLTPFNESPSVFIVNKSLLAKLGIEVNGYEDLLQPELKGKIAMTDPGASSSAWGQMVNMLYAMGKGDPEAGWDYVDKFVENLDGILVNGSSAVYKGVADGEYAVGLTYEEPVINYILAGADVDVVYMEEGCIFKGDGVYLIDGAKNEENAKQFIDFVTGYEVQTMINTDLHRRAVRTDIPSNDVLKSTSEINVIEDDETYEMEHKEDWLNKWQELIINNY